MGERRGIPYQVYIPPVDYMYDNNMNGPVRNQRPRQYSDPPSYLEINNQTGTNDSDGSHYTQHLHPGANRYDMQSQSFGTVTSTRTNHTYDYVQDDRMPSYNGNSNFGSEAKYPGSEYASGGGVQNYTVKKKGGRSHRYVIKVAVALVALAILGAAAAAALKVTVFKDDESVIADAQQGNNPIDGVWSEWPAWTDCSSTCGNGTMTRNRTCDNPSPVFGGDDCEGSATETQTCMLANCSVNGNWSEWRLWSACSTSCDNGTRTRNRTCDNPLPLFGGLECEGSDTESEDCTLANCPVDGNWSLWKDWSDCSVTCGDGVQIRNRTCDNPSPAFGGNDCDGSASESQTCMLVNCSINGNWSEWDPWTDCSESCDNGTRNRNRICDNPPPAFDGDDCVGSNTEEEVCMLKYCPINGNWSNWENWSGCSTTCGGGIRNRTRHCDNPIPQHNGQDCEGNNLETSSCAEDTCPPPGTWGAWSEWSDCSKICGEGVSTRTRPCDDSAGGECIGTDTETQTCQDWKCWGPWGAWNDCSLTCGSGKRIRERMCDGKYTGQECGWHYPTFKDTKTCTNSVTCQQGFCESRSANCSYNHPTRCDMFITCDAGKIMFEQVCNVLMWYQVQDTNPCLGHCDWEANVQCTL